MVYILNTAGEMVYKLDTLQAGWSTNYLWVLSRLDPLLRIPLHVVEAYDHFQWADIVTSSLSSHIFLAQKSDFQLISFSVRFLFVVVGCVLFYLFFFFGVGVGVVGVRGAVSLYLLFSIICVIVKELTWLKQQNTCMHVSILQWMSLACKSE